MDFNGSNCPFCHLTKEQNIIRENAYALAIYDAFPVSKGHVLIIPKRHFPNFFEISKKEYEAIGELIQQLKKLIDNKYKPDGYNIGININEVAGQTVPHCHIHLIPRYTNDVSNPRGGVRHVIPTKGNY